MAIPDAFRPSRTTIATYTSYPEAERAVDRLADARFPVEHLTIVGHGLRSREQVVGRSTWGRALGAGALQGALVGALFGLIFSLFTLDPFIAFGWLLVGGLLYGALAGALVGLLFHAFRNRDRDFVSARGLEAERYELVVDDERLADEASRLLDASA
jgi:hypothetical protein